MSSPGISITSDNRGPAVNLAAWISMVTMCLVTLLKVFSRLLRVSKGFQIQNLQADDYAVTLAMIMAIGQTVAISQQVPAGLGEHVTTLIASQIETFEKAGYASEYLYIAALCSAKLATLRFLRTLARLPIHSAAILGTIVFTATWAVVAIFGVALQCSVPRSWAIISESCFDQRAFWLAIGATDIGIDLALVGLPIYILWGLQLSWSKKSVVMFAFAIRTISVPLTALRLFYITQALGSSDRTYELFTATVVTQVGMNVSIIVTCIPFVKQFLDHIQPGWSTSDIRTGLGYNTIMGRSGKDYPMGSVVKSANHTNTTDIQKTGQPWSEDGILESRTFTATIEPRAPTPGGSVLEGTKLRQTIGCIMHSEPADTV